jgi:hypothetical protein
MNFARSHLFLSILVKLFNNLKYLIDLDSYTRDKKRQNYELKYFSNKNMFIFTYILTAIYPQFQLK